MKSSKIIAAILIACISKCYAADKAPRGNIQHLLNFNKSGTCYTSRFTGSIPTECDLRDYKLALIIAQLKKEGKTIHLYEANLQGVDFTNADLSNLNLSHANLRDAIFTNANLTGTKLERADLRGATLDNANIKNTSFYGAILKDVKGLETTQNLKEAKFDEYIKQGGFFI